LGATRLLVNEKLDEIRYNQQDAFTKWSAQLFEAISQNNAEEKALVAKNKLLGFQNFDFNLVLAPFKLSFSDVHLQFEPRTYVCCPCHCVEFSG
jgi:hypothetical protein